MIKVKQIKDLAVTIQRVEDDIKKYVAESYEPIINKKSAFNKDFGTTSGTVAEGNHIHELASQTQNGFISKEDKIKLDGVEKGANNYVHPTGNGHLHLPASNSNNNGDFLKVTDSITGEAEWTSIEFSDIQNTPTTLEGYGITNAANKSETEQRFIAIEEKLNSKESITDSDIESIINFVQKGE